MLRSPLIHPATARRTIAVLAAAGLLLTACGSDDESTADVTAAATADDASAPAAAPSISGAWARTSPTMATMGAAYMTITSDADDRLVAAAVDAAVAGRAEIHEVVPADGMSGDGDDHGAMGGGATSMPMGGTGDTMAPAMVMQQIDGLDLPAGTAVELRPGGYHIMLVDLVAPLAVGATISVTLTFEQAGDVVVDVPVRDEAP